MLTYLTRLTDERDRLTAHATALTEQAARDDRDLTDTERQTLATMEGRCADIDGQLTTYNAQAESQRNYAKLRADTERETPPVGGIERRPAVPAQPEPPEAWGDVFVRSAAFTDYPGAGTSRQVDLPFDLEQRAAIGIGTYPAAGLPPYIWTPPAYTYSSPLLDVVGKVSTSSNAVSYVKWAPNPQAAASVVAEGALKPEAVMSATAASQSLVTWAHWKEITRQALEDIPQIRSTVEGRLRQGLVRAIEDSIAANLIAATLPAVVAPAGSNLLTAIRMGVGTVQAAGYSNPNAVLLNPADYATLDLFVMTNANMPPVSQSGFWGLRPIASTGVPAGTAWVGDFSAGVTLFTRGTAQVFLTDSHADNFIRNVLLLLAETRGLAVVGEVAAIAECTVAP
jgi:hypothetical protein